MATSLLKRAAEGLAAGVAGTVVIQGANYANKRWLPQWDAPEAEDPGSFMVWQGEKHLSREAWMKVPGWAETAGAFALSFGYGAAFGALFAAVRDDREGMLPVIVDGAVLGTVVWAVGYLGWLPAAGLIPAPHKQEVKQHVGPVVQHVIYGIATVAALRWIAKKLG